MAPQVQHFVVASSDQRVQFDNMILESRFIILDLENHPTSHCGPWLGFCIPNLERIDELFGIAAYAVWFSLNQEWWCPSGGNTGTHRHIICAPENLSCGSRLNHTLVAMPHHSVLVYIFTPQCAPKSPDRKHVPILSGNGLLFPNVILPPSAIYRHSLTFCHVKRYNCGWLQISAPSNLFNLSSANWE